MHTSNLRNPCIFLALCFVLLFQVFGEEEEEEEDSAMMAPPPSYSPPHESPTWPAEGTVSPPPTPSSSSQIKEEETIVSPPPRPPTQDPMEEVVSPPPLPPHDSLPTSPDTISPPPPSTDTPEVCLCTDHWTKTCSLVLQVVEQEQPSGVPPPVEGGLQLEKPEESPSAPRPEEEKKDDTNAVSLSGVSNSCLVF